MVDGLEALYRSRLPEFTRVAAALAGDPDAGRDAVQDAFAKALRKRRRYREGNLEGWVWRIVVNSARDAARRRRRSLEMPVLVEARAEELGLPLELLTVRQREVLFPHYYARRSRKRSRSAQERSERHRSRPTGRSIDQGIASDEQAPAPGSFTGAKLLMHDLPDAVATLEAAHEEHTLRQARARQEGTQPDVDDHCAPPYARAAVVLSLPTSLAIDSRQVCAHDLRSAPRFREAKSRVR